MLGVKFLALCCGSIFHQKQLHPLSILRRSTPAVWNSLPATVLGSRSSSYSNFYFKNTLVVTLARPSIRSSLKITNRSFRCAAPCLWNKLSNDLRDPRQIYSLLHFHLTHGSSSSSPSSLSPLASSLTRSFILSFSANHFHHRPFPFLLD